MKILAPLQPLGLLIMRVALGVIMILHGYPKVMNIHAWMGVLAKMGIPPWMAYVNAWGGELLGGACVLLGFVTPFAALVVAINLIVAIVKSHVPHVGWTGISGPGGYELALATL